MTVDIWAMIDEHGDDTLEHWGVKGMKWGVRRDRKRREDIRTISNGAMSATSQTKNKFASICESNNWNAAGVEAAVAEHLGTTTRAYAVKKLGNRADDYVVHAGANSRPDGKAIDSIVYTAHKSEVSAARREEAKRNGYVRVETNDLAGKRG